MKWKLLITNFSAVDIASPLKNYRLRLELYAQSINANPPLSALGQFRTLRAAKIFIHIGHLFFNKRYLLYTWLA
jgi:hypothetical protein